MNKHNKYKSRKLPQIRSLFGATLLLFLAFLLYAPSTHAETLPQTSDCPLDANIAHDQYTPLSTAGLHKSPFGPTSKLCLGVVSNNGSTAGADYLFQIAVQLPAGSDKANPKVIVTDAAGVNVPMVKDDGNATLWISSVPFHVGPTNMCNASAKISVTMDGIEGAQPGSVSLCNNNSGGDSPGGDDKDTWVRTASNFNGPNGTSSGRTFVGYIGINLGKPISDENSQYQALEQAGITGLKITGEGCGSKECTTDAKLVSASAGVVTIDANGLSPAKKYVIELTYDLPSVDPQKYGGVDTVWQSHVLKFDNGGDGYELKPSGPTIFTTNEYNEKNLAYYDASGTPGAKVLTGTGTGETEKTCQIEGIGWIVCPVTTFLGKIADGTINILNDFFKVPAKNIFDTNNEAYKYWQQIRNYANIMFVIAFLIIIFSQITGAGITNYGIKKLLPKLIATALLVNLSFIICALLVDASNLLGYSLASLLGNSITNGTGDASSANAWAQGNLFGGIVASAIVLGAAVAAVYFALAAVVSVLISVVIIGVTMVILLGIRQALIILLVVIAPLAFVALLLPNTEGLFKKWLNLFKSMLLIFPIASLLYGAGKLASGILMTSTDNMIVQVIGAALPVIMLVAIYKVFNSAMNALEGVGGFVNGIRGGIGKAGQKATGASDKAIQNSTYGQFRKYGEGEASRRRALIQGGAYAGKGGKWNPRNWGSSAHKAFNEHGISGNFGNRLAASGAAVVNAQDDEYLKNAGARIDGFQYTDSATNKVMTLSQPQMMAMAIGSGDIKDSAGKVILKRDSIDPHMQRAAVQRAAKIATVDDAEQLATATSNSSMSASMRKTISDSLAQSSVMAKAPHLAGKPLGDMQSGTFDLHKSALGAVSQGKIKAESLSMLDAKSAETIYKAVSSTTPGSNERALLKAAADELYKPGSRLTEKVVAGSTLDTHLLNMRKL